MLQVIEIEVETSEHLLDGVAVAIVERGVGCHARANLVEVLVAWVALHDLVDVEFALGAWADESHVADEHVVELRQLIEVMAAEEASHLCQAVVVLAGGELRPSFSAFSFMLRNL